MCLNRLCRFALFFVWGTAAAWLAGVSEVRADELMAVDFVRHVAPIFERHCVRCHHADDRKGDVSLQTRDDVLQAGYVLPGQPEQSHLLEIVRTGPDGEPPTMPKEGELLSSAELDVMRRWIAAGADWPASHVIRLRPKADTNWWSLQPVRNVQPPDVPELSAAWAVNPIDRFVGAMLAEHGLRPSPEADRRTLIRRLYFDLLGLPPTPEEVRQFVEDDRPLAYERLVDRLLASPHFGERWARHWLDIAHYADTHGFERDQRRDNAYPYRDYVIRAFNDDKPYDQFLREQIAGDVLDPHNADAVAATGFLAAGPWDFVGQVETKSDVLRRAARADDLDDIVTTVMTATMGLTIHCARCHDHKLDPITQRDYYALWATFAGVKRGERDLSEAATQSYHQQKAATEKQLNEVLFKIGQLRGQPLDLADMVGGGNGLGTGTKGNGLDPRTAKTQTRSFGFLGNIQPNKFATCEHPFVDGVFIPDGGESAGKGDTPPSVVVSSTGLAITDLPDTSAAAWDAIRHGPVASQDITTLGGVDYNSAGHSLLGLHANAGITFDLVAIREATGYGTTRFESRVGYGGRSEQGRADFAVYVDGRRLVEHRQLAASHGGIDIHVDLPADARFLTLIATDGGNGIGFDQIFFGDPFMRVERDEPLNATQQARLAELDEEARLLRSKLAAIGPPPRVYAVVSQPPAEIHVLRRGNPETPGDIVEPAALECLEVVPSQFAGNSMSEGERRLALAAWITHPDNPLTRRVIVNRLWHHHFGRGIVETPSDFGFGGAQPTHPELLDWLADQLLANGWSLKPLHRLLVTSQTYRQQSYQVFTSTDSFESGGTNPFDVDADNRWLWRMNPRRLDAESVRDAVLSITGNLNPQMFGPGYRDFTYQDAYAPIYTYVTPDSPELWRRSVYRFVVRSTPHRFMTALDCPNPANLTPRRLQTTTALQSLALLNNDFMLKQAQFFVERITSEAGSDPARQSTRAFELAFARQPTVAEHTASMRVISEAGLFQFSRMLMNANEFIYID